MIDGCTIKRLPPDRDPRGPNEIKALDRAHLSRAYRDRLEQRGTPRPFCWHTLRYVRDSKGGQGRLPSSR